MKGQKTLLVVLVVVLLGISGLVGCGGPEPTQADGSQRKLSWLTEVLCPVLEGFSVPNFSIDAIYVLRGKNPPDKGKAYHNGDTIPIPLTGPKVYLLLEVSTVGDYMETDCERPDGAYYGTNVYLYAGSSPEGGTKLQPMEPSFGSDQIEVQVTGDDDHYQVCASSFYLQWSITADYLPFDDPVSLSLVVGFPEGDSGNNLPRCLMNYGIAEVTLVKEVPEEESAESSVEEVSESSLPTAKLRVEGTKVVRSKVENDTGKFLQWHFYHEGESVLERKARDEYSFDLLDIPSIFSEPGEYTVTLEIYQDKSGEGRYVTISNEVTVVVGKEASLGCTPNAVFVGDVTVPDGTVFEPGAQFDKIWRIRNTGDCPWDSDYHWVFWKSNQMGADTSHTIPPTAPGETADIRVTMYAPDTPGLYVGHWRLEAPDGQIFGHSAYVNIVVKEAIAPEEAIEEAPAPEEHLVKIPDVVGLTPKEAESKLKEAGFDVLPGKDGYSNDVPAGHIFRQAPGAGERYDPKNTVVMIYRSLGPDTSAPPAPIEVSPVEVGPNEIWLVGKYETTSEYCEGDACAKGNVLKNVSQFIAGSNVPLSSGPGKVFVIEELGGRCQVGSCVGQSLGVFSKDHEVEVRGLVIMLNGKEVAGWSKALGGDCLLPDSAQGSNLYMTICPSSDYYSKPYE